jgi:hypothetical protein
MLAKLSSSSSSAPPAFPAAVGLLLLSPALASLCRPRGGGGGAPGSVSSSRACPAFWGGLPGAYPLLLGYEILPTHMRHGLLWVWDERQ